jgi:DNA invertase Pin-like site-specific DNA recombinase
MERSILSGSPRLRPDPRKHLLAKRGKSQRAIARELGISRITVARVLEEPIDRHLAAAERRAYAIPDSVRYMHE